MFKLMSFMLLLLLFVSIINCSEENEREFTTNDCEEGSYKGRMLCVGDLEVWWWHHDEQKCKIDTIGTQCTRSLNSFDSQEDCEKIAKKICEGIIFEPFGGDI